MLQGTITLNDFGLQQGDSFQLIFLEDDYATVSLKATAAFIELCDEDNNGRISPQEMGTWVDQLGQQINFQVLSVMHFPTPAPIPVDHPIDGPVPNPNANVE